MIRIAALSAKVMQAKSDLLGRLDSLCRGRRYPGVAAADGQHASAPLGQAREDSPLKTTHFPYQFTELCRERGCRAGPGCAAKDPFSCRSTRCGEGAEPRLARSISSSAKKKKKAAAARARAARFPPLSASAPLPALINLSQAPAGKKNSAAAGFLPNRAETGGLARALRAWIILKREQRQIARHVEMEKNQPVGEH